MEVKLNDEYVKHGVKAVKYEQKGLTTVWCIDLPLSLRHLKCLAPDRAQFDM